MTSVRRRGSVGLEVQIDVPAADPSEMELQPTRTDNTAGLESAGAVEQHLEAADGGAAAWRILGSAFMFEAVLFGEPTDLTCRRKTRLLSLFEVSRYHLVSFKTTILSFHNSRAIPMYLWLAQWRLGYRIWAAL